jgi:hypothetical protein
MENNTVVILPLLYLGNIQYWTKLVHFESVIFNDMEKYPKGTFRNRCHVASSQGILNLSVPLLGGKHSGQAYTEVKTDSNANWQRRHWHSILTCYGSAPFFCHYGQKLKIYYESNPVHLWKWNLAFTQLIMDWLQMSSKKWSLLSEHESVENQVDLTHFFSPKPRFYKPDTNWKTEPYPQIFEQNIGFIANCSILDLIFCQGPYAINILKKSYLSEK